MKNFYVCDMHCDTPSVLFDNASEADFSVFSNTQFFACFISPKYYDKPKERCLMLMNNFKKIISKNNDKIKLCRSFSDIGKKKINAFLSVEGGECIKSLNDLKYFYNLGIRLLTLTWNFDNQIGGANGSVKGLSDFGKKLIPAMNEMGMIADLSHSGEKTFFDAVDICKKPFVLSHSNSYSLCPHQRNITDSQFKELIKIGGCVGINFYPPFLTKNKTADIYDVVSHIEHFLSLGGENNIGIGSDFDGIDCVADGLSSARDIGKIFDILSSHGVSDEIIEKIAYKNVFRILRICL